MSGQTLIAKIRLFAAAALLAASCSSAFAQKAALKTNLVSDALLSPNVGVEFAVAPKWTINTAGQVNFWTVNDHKWKHWLVQPEVRYWFCRHFSGHFLGFHAIGGQYNFGNIDADFKFLGSDFSNLKDRRYQGWGVGAGIGYGYDWILSRHWNLEAEIGFGWIYTRFDSYPCAHCGSKLDHNKPHNYVGPTKAAINLVYVF